MNQITIARFWEKVNKSGPIPSHVPHLGPCWIWTSSKRNKGYGAFAWTNETGKVIQGRAHRFAYELMVGPVLNDDCVLHYCDNPACVRPSHLWTGTKAQNNADMHTKGRAVKGGTHCGAANYERGSNHHNARLNENQIRQIRCLKQKLSYSQLSKQFGLAVGYLHRIVNRKAWSHVQ